MEKREDLYFPETKIDKLGLLLYNSDEVRIVDLSDVRVEKIDYVVRYTPSVPRFCAGRRPNHIIGLKLTGASEHFFGDRSFMMDDNCIYFLNQAEEYRVENHSYGECLSVHFTSFRPISAKSFCRKLSDSRSVLSLLEQIEGLYRGGRGNSSRAFSALYGLLDRYESIHAGRYRPERLRVEEAKAYLYAHQGEKGCIDEAAKRCSLSRRRFNDVFQRHFHLTPNEFLMEDKISRAKAMLAAGELSVQEIAELCGFSDVYYFSKRFKLETGYSPTQYRKMQF